MDNVKYYFPFIFRLKIFPQSPIMLAAGSHLFKGKSTSQKRLTSAFSFFTFVSSQLTMAIKQELRGKLNSFFFFLFVLFLFCCSSTFKDAERASLRDSGHGDSDQADSDQDTNKGSHCDTSAREALKMKATAVNGQPFEQGEWTS